MPTSNTKKQGIRQQANHWVLLADQEAALPRYRPDVSQIRHCHQVNCFKATCHRGTDSTTDIYII